MTNPTTDDSLLATTTICDSCFRASCWQGIFYCDNAKTAGTIEMPLYELQQLNLENSDYWGNDD